MVRLLAWATSVLTNGRGILLTIHVLAIADLQINDDNRWLRAGGSAPRAKTPRSFPWVKRGANRLGLRASRRSP